MDTLDSVNVSIKLQDKCLS